MVNSKPGLLGILKQSFKDFMKDDCMTSAAALSYYTVFSLPAVLMLIMLLVSSVMDPSDVRGRTRVSDGVSHGSPRGRRGPDDSAEDRAAGRRPDTDHRRSGGTCLRCNRRSGAASGGAESGVERGAGSEQGGIKSFLTKRLFSLGMLLSIAFLLLVSLVVSAVLSALGDRLSGFLPAGLSEPVLEA